jgi:uncharacterized protein involved in exopolysaccharide biosynthesis
MENNSNVPAGSNTNKVVEIDLIELAHKIWIKRAFIAKVTAVFFVFGVLIAFLSPKEYTSSIVVVPQTGDANSKLGGLSGLASMAGINISDMSGSQTLSPTVYPQILGSITYQKELLQTQVKFEDIDHPISLFDAYTNEKYKKTNVLGFIKKYTIGLPGLILKSLKEEDVVALSDSNKYITMSEDEKKAIDMLSDKVSITLNDKDGYITIAANASEPLVATQITIAAQKLLQKYITAIKIEKAEQTLDFVQGRYSEAKRDYETAQIRLASYQDLNRNVISAVSKAQSDKLANDYNLAFSVYSELAKQLEQAKIQVKDATPVLSIVQPAFVPIEKSKPKRAVILISFIFMGVLCSVIFVLFKYFFLNRC